MPASTFRAAARHATPAAADLCDTLRGRLAEHLDLAADGARLRFETPYYLIELEPLVGALDIAVAGTDADMLAQVKAMLLYYLQDCLGETAFAIAWTGETAPAAVRATRVFRRLNISRIVGLGPRMRRLTLTGAGVAALAEGGLHVHLLLPQAGSAPLPEPQVAESGRLLWPEGVPEPAIRAYTIRRIDPDRGELDIDFLLHGDADHAPPGAGFAVRAALGDEIALVGPGGRSVPPARRYVLAGDETALPMIARILEGLDGGTEVTTLVEVTDAGDEQALPEPLRRRVTWLHRAGGGEAPSGLLEAALCRLPIDPADADGFVFFAGESRAAKRVRRHLRDVVGLPPARYMVAGFWDA